MFHLLQFEGLLKNILQRRSRVAECNHGLVHTVELHDIMFDEALFRLQQSTWSRVTTCWSMLVVMLQNPLLKCRRMLPIAIYGILQNM
jgi:hypothetical protein